MITTATSTFLRLTGQREWDCSLTSHLSALSKASFLKSSIIGHLFGPHPSSRLRTYRTSPNLDHLKKISLWLIWLLIELMSAWITRSAHSEDDWLLFLNKMLSVILRWKNEKELSSLAPCDCVCVCVCVADCCAAWGNLSIRLFNLA